MATTGRSVVFAASSDACAGLALRRAPPRGSRECRRVYRCGRRRDGPGQRQWGLSSRASIRALSAAGGGAWPPQPRRLTGMASGGRRLQGTRVVVPPRRAVLHGGRRWRRTRGVRRATRADGFRGTLRAPGLSIAEDERSAGQRSGVARSIAVFGDVNMNIIDGSSVWVQSIALMLATLRDTRVTLLLRAPE